MILKKLPPLKSPRIPHTLSLPAIKQEERVVSIDIQLYLIISKQYGVAIVVEISITISPFPWAK